MRVRTSLAGVFALMVVSFAAASAPPAPSYTRNGFDPGLLDPALPAAQRTALFAKIIALANDGQVRAQDLAGTLYWQGAKIPGSPMAQNLDQARVLLGNAAIHGDVTAMAKLAELELEAGRTEQAMIWAQMYARYLDPMASSRSHRGHGSAYASDLIQRVVRAGGKIDDKLHTDFNRMVERFDTSIRRGIEAYDAERRHGDVRIIRPPIAIEKRENDKLNGIVDYVVGFDAEGRPAKVWPLAAFPIPKLETAMLDRVDHVMVNPDKDSHGMRYLQLSITHNAARYRMLRPTH